MALKNRGKVTADGAISQSEFGRRIGVSPQRITKFIDAGIVKKREDGKLDFAESLASAQAYLESQAKTQEMFEGKQAIHLKWMLLRCELAKAELDRVLEKVHDKEACARSLTEARVAESRNLMALGDRLASRFPELGHRIKAACDEEVAAVLTRLHNGQAFGSLINNKPKKGE